ncbi:MAG TPA: tetratricopeptide repeat protein [Bryobacteraceae bacterium]|jgi:tetratricopeptide (TPR) repeat protein|nr:tetratricopeptide repeat protein [Bryobacteraceae bacterium]
MSAAVLLAVLLSQISPSTTPPAPLVSAQSLLDAGRLQDAAKAIQAYLGDHANSADGHYLLAYALFREGNARPSLEEFAKASALRAPRPLDLQVAGCDYFLLEDYAKADELLTLAAQGNPSDLTTLYFLGRTKYNRKRFGDAARLLAQCPASAVARNYLGLSLEQLGRPEEALTAYHEAIALDANDPAPRLNLGTLLTNLQRASEAVPPLQKASELAPSDFQTHLALGKAYLALGRLEEAQAEIERAAGEAPANAPLHFVLAEVYRKRGFAQKAAAENAKYASLTGSHSSPDSPLREARTLIEMNKQPEAERVVRRYISEHANSAAGHFLLGYILFKKEDAKGSLAEYTEGARYGTPSAADLQAVAADYVLLKDYPDADKWFSKALEWKPDDALGWYYLGRTKYNENRFEEAIAAFEHCLKLDPKNIKAEDNLGLSLEGLNRTDEAMAAYRQAIAWQTGAAIQDSGPLLDLGSLLVDAGRSREAIGHLLQAEGISPGDYRIHRALGKAYSHANELDKARAELERAAALAPENAPVHFMLAQVYRKQGLHDKARIEDQRYTSLAGPDAAGGN